MAKKHSFQGPVDLQKFEIQNARLQNLFDFPPDPFEGQIIYKSDIKLGAFFDGTDWVLLGGDLSIDQVTGLQNALNGKASSSHTHTIDQVTGLGQVPIRQVFSYLSSNIFSLSHSNPTPIYVTLNGQVLEEGSLYDWTISGTNLTVTTPLRAGDEISILYYTDLPSITNYGRNIDGGVPDSVYLAIQNVDGGTP